MRSQGNSGSEVLNSGGSGNSSGGGGRSSGSRGDSSSGAGSSYTIYEWCRRPWIAPPSMDGRRNLVEKIAMRCMECSIKLPYIHGKAFYPWMTGIHEWYATTMTSSTNLADASPVLPLNLLPNQYSTSTPPFVSSTPYHYAPSGVRVALLSCFTVSSKGMHKRFADLGMWLAALHWAYFGARFLPTPDILFEASVTCTETTLYQWLNANASVHICGRRLKSWTSRRPSSPISTILLRVGLLHSWPLLGGKKMNKLLQRAHLTLRRLYILCSIAILLVVFYFIYIPAVIGPLLILIWILTMIEFSTRLRKRILKNFDDRIPVFKPGKRLILADKGFIGMVDDRAEKGDVLCHLVGCSEPVVLRRAIGYGEGATERKTYTVIGECYIHFPKDCLYEFLGPTNRSADDYEDKKREWIRNTQVEEIDLI